MPTNADTSPDSAQHAHEVGRRIADARIRAGLTQAQLAAEIGITAGAVAQYETGRNLPRPSNTLKIAARCGVAIGWLLNGAGATNVETQTEHDMLMALRALPPELRPIALAQVRALAAISMKHVEEGL